MGLKLRVLLEPRFGATYDQLESVAIATEEADLDAFFRSDHFLGLNQEDTNYAPTDAWTTLGGLARSTSRVKLGTLMSASTFRHPSVLAIAAASADAMSGGRIELGLGAAWMVKEHLYYGIPFPPLRERFDRFEEQLAIITGLWTTPPGQTFSFDGKHYQLDACANFPAHSSTPRPSLIVGGGGPKRTPTLAARYADEFNSGTSNFANFRRICETVGRDPATVRLSTTIAVCVAQSAAEAESRAAGLGEVAGQLLSRGVVGTAADLRPAIEKVQAEGADIIYFHLFENDLDQIRRLGEMVPSFS